jgi:hypothetical protein
MIQLHHEKGRFEALVTAYARNDMGRIVALSIVGAGTALDAIRSSVSLGKLLNFKPKGVGEPMLLMPDEDASYRLFKTRLEQQRRDHYFIVHPHALSELSEGTQYVFAPISESPEQALGKALRRICSIPILEHWYPYLYAHQMGLERYRRRAERLTPDGGLHLWAIKIEDSYWQSVISLGLEQGEIRFNPEVKHG